MSPAAPERQRPAPEPDIFDDYGTVSSLPARDTARPLQVEANRPLPIEDDANLAGLKRIATILTASRDTGAGRRVSGQSFFDPPSYVNT